MIKVEELRRHVWLAVGFPAGAWVLIVLLCALTALADPRAITWQNCIMVLVMATLLAIPVGIAGAFAFWLLLVVAKKIRGTASA